MTASDRLAELEQAVHDARQRAGKLEQALRSSQRIPQRARDALLAYFEEVGSGEREHDPAEEQRLREAVRETETRFTVRPIMINGAAADWEAVDLELEGKLAGVRRVVEQREAELRRFASEHLTDLAAERMERSEEAAQLAREALELARRADGAWRAETVSWARLARLAGRERLIDELSESPFAQLPAPIEEPGVPAPASLTPRKA